MRQGHSDRSPANFKDITGQRFGRWLVTGLHHRDHRGNAFLSCVCDCGTHRAVGRSNLLNGSSKSCGCLKRDFLAGQTTDETGRMFGRLTVLARAGTDADDKATWRCMCVCGNECVVSGRKLRTGNTRSCGCLREDVASVKWLVYGMPTRKTHGATVGGKHTLTYHSWTAMIQRCTNPNTVKFPDYGGRGITVCDRWRYSFSTFLDDMGERPSKGHSLDRLDVNGSYSPANCRWATIAEQAHNKRKPLLTDAEKHLRYLARRSVAKAIRAGRLVAAKSLSCFSCGVPAHSLHHFLGYEPEHWLDVIPMCRACHGAAG